MYSIAKLSEQDKRILFRNTAQKSGLIEVIVEKDFWVCIMLDYLFHRCQWKNMAEHQHDTHATPLKQYFKTVIDWVELTFPIYRSKLMRGLDWGLLYNQYSGNVYDPNELETEIKKLLQDDDVTKQKGVYEYLLSGKTKEKVLSIRAFTDNEKRTMYERQNGICPMCAAEGKEKHWELEEMHADHKIPWSRGGHTTLDNGQMLCRDHNLQKSDI